MIAGFRASNHPRQVARDGARDEVDDRATPAADFANLDRRFGGFTLDVAAAPHNAKCERYYTRDDDGLTLPWFGNVWCNPPFSDLGAWVRKAWAEWSEPTEHLYRIVMLVPANRAEQGWWQELVEPFRDRDAGLRTEFLPGRMRFEFPEGVPAPKHNRPLFGCCLLIWEDR